MMLDKRPAAVPLRYLRRYISGTDSCAVFNPTHDGIVRKVIFESGATSCAKNMPASIFAVSFYSLSSEVIVSTTARWQNICTT